MKNALLITALLAAGTYAPKAAADYTVTCESNSGQTRNCPLNSSGKVHLQTQLSRAVCFEGQSCGTYDNSVWVSNGCRATFRVSQNNSYNRNYSSSSNNGKAAAAAAAILIGAAAVAAASNKNNSHGSYSNSGYNDRYGDNYNNYGNNGYNNGYNNNYGNNHNNYGNNYGSRSITCESRDRNRQRCSTFVGRGNVQISRKLSNAACRFGQDWDYDNNAIYVWNGCRAIFSVY